MTHNPPAFPQQCADALDVGMVHTGMSLRDWIAGQALAGFIANPNTPDQLIGHGFLGSKDILAEWAYAAADAMLEARKQGDAA